MCLGWSNGEGSQRRKSTPDTTPNRHTAENFGSCHTVELLSCHSAERAGVDVVPKNIEKQKNSNGWHQACPPLKVFVFVAAVAGLAGLVAGLQKKSCVGCKEAQVLFNSITQAH